MLASRFGITLTMPEAFIIDAVRTPVTRRGGPLVGAHPADLGAEEISAFRAADLIAGKWGITRPEMERYALASHQRAIQAIDTGAFKAEIVPYGDVSRDDGPRRDTTLGKMAALPPLREGGRITAALSSQIADGAAAGPRPGAHRWPLRPAHHVRGRRPGERHDHRAPVSVIRGRRRREPARESG